jgi:predicted NAD/FAD-binding protein
MRIAVIGSGIAGLASAWLLEQRHQVTLFEADARFGGHTHTVDVEHEGNIAPVDTGFLVCNDWTYPHLLAFFSALGVQTVASNMSFSVRMPALDLEWSGTSLNSLFAQRRNFLRPAFYGMLRDILRFNRDAKRWLHLTSEDLSLGEFLDRGNYGTWLRDAYLLPMAAAIWSCPEQQMTAYPARSFLQFCANHGLLNVLHRPQWRTVSGGGLEYVQRIIAGLADARHDYPIHALEPTRNGVRVHGPAGEEEFDAVVSAVHSDQAAALLGVHWPEQRNALERIRYQPNRAILHRDRSFLPQRRGAWSAWNFHAEGSASGTHPVSVSYLINHLQPLPFHDPVIVTLNPEREPNPQLVWKEIAYAHPIFDAAALQAQSRLQALQGKERLFFAGAWLGHGFHEDGMRSAVAVAHALNVWAPWEQPDQVETREIPALWPQQAH